MYLVLDLCFKEEKKKRLFSFPRNVNNVENERPAQNPELTRMDYVIGNLQLIVQTKLYSASSPSFRSKKKKEKKKRSFFREATCNL